jgi:hypothetical protein
VVGNELFKPGGGGGGGGGGDVGDGDDDDDDDDNDDHNDGGGGGCGGSPTWRPSQGKHTNIHPFVGPAKGVKKSEAPHIYKDNSLLAVLMLFFYRKFLAAGGTDQPVLSTAPR